MKLLKKCPKCGKRFSVEKKGKELVNTEHHTERVVLEQAAERAGLVADGSLQNPTPSPIETEVPVETETFETTFECVHCHHKWQEESVEVLEGAADTKAFHR